MNPVCCTQNDSRPRCIVEKTTGAGRHRTSDTFTNGYPLIFISCFQHPKSILRLVRPNIIGNLADQLELVNHTIPVNGIALTVRSKSTLRANTDLVQSSLNRDVVTLGNDLGSIEHAGLHLLLVLHSGKLAGDNAQDDILVWWQVLEGLETTGTLGVVLQVIGVHVQLLEQLDGDAVIATLGEVTATDEVAAAQMHANVHVRRQADEAVVVQLDVLLEQVVGAVDVERVLLEAVQELLRAEV